MAIRSRSVADTKGVEESGVLRRTGLWCVVFGLVGVFSLIGFFDFTRCFPHHPSRIRLVMEMLSRLWGGVKDRGQMVVGQFGRAQ